MAFTTIKVTPATRDRVKALGASTHETAEQVVSRALDELDRRVFWERFAQTHAAHAAETEAHAADDAVEREDAALWAGTLRDGLE